MDEQMDQRHLMRRLAATLYRADCPSPQELGDWRLGLVDAARAATFQAHLQICPHCAREVAQLDAYLASLAPELEPRPVARTEPPQPASGMLDRMRVLVAELVRGPGGLQTAFGAVRGAEDAGVSIYRAGDVQISLQVEDDPDQPDRKLLTGLVTSAEGQAWRVDAWRADEPIASARVDEIGQFVLPSLAPGEYQLIFTSNQDSDAASAGAESTEIRLPLLAL